MKLPERQFNALTPDQENSGSGKNKESESIKETTAEIVPVAETEVSFGGIQLPKAEDSTGNWVPRQEKYTDFIHDNLSDELQTDIARAFSLGQPILIEGGTSIGKTTAVMEMCSRLGWEVHYANLNYGTDESKLMGKPMPNVHRKGPEDPEYVYWLGKVSSGLVSEPGKVKVILLDEIGAAQAGNLIMLHEVLDQIARGDSVDLSEYGNGVVQVDSEKVKIIALTNPPGKGYQSRNIVDPALMRRFVYKKAPNELPDESMNFYVNSLFNQSEILQEISGMAEVLEKYKEFHKAAKELLKNREIAEDQPQPFTFDDRMEPRRVRDFVSQFYTGDINETFQQALQYYYANKLESEADKKNLGELIRLVEYKPKVAKSKRKGTEREEKTAEKTKPETKRTETMPETKLEGPVAEQIEVAIEKLGKENVFGPKEIEKIFGVRLAEVPGIPFSVEEFERAEKLGQMLMLRVDKTAEGKPMSLEAMTEIMARKWKDKGKGDLLDTANSWKTLIGEDLFTKESPRAGWALVSKEPLGYKNGNPDKDILMVSTSKNYVEQTEVIIKTLTDGAFKGMDLPEEYAEAIAEFESQKDALVELMDDDWQKAAKELAGLKITQMTGGTFAETIYDLAAYHDVNNERLLPNNYTWSASLNPDGFLVFLGFFGAVGVRGGRWLPGVRIDGLGVSLSRRL